MVQCMDNFCLENYWIYRDLVLNGNISIDTTRDVTNDNWGEHIKSLHNILLDGIEDTFVHAMKVYVTFANNKTLAFSIFDYFINLAIWKPFIAVGEPITTDKIFFKPDFTKDDIKEYFDDKFVEYYRDKVDTISLNNMIDDAMHVLSYIDDFSNYFSNTINIEDFIALEKAEPRVREIIHADMSNVPIEEIKDLGQQMHTELIGYMKKHNHSLAVCFRAHEAINERQNKECFVNIGPKPDGLGTVFPIPINKSFVTGGVKELPYFFIESSVGRTAQIISKMNVGTSGHFARLLGLNNRDTILNPDPHYDCHSHNFVKITITDEKMLQRLATGRYYRLNPNGLEYKLTKRSTNLIGKTIYLRSPITCASKSTTGICYKCYGDLAYTNRMINIGQIASELLSSVLTQKLLSAKHLLEASVTNRNWVPAFKDFFEVDCNVIKLSSSFEDPRGYQIMIDPDEIETESEEDECEYDEYITRFEVVTPTGKIIPIYDSPVGDESATKLYIGNVLNGLIREFGDTVVNGVRKRIVIGMEKFQEDGIFLIHITNNELSKTLESVKSIINKKSETESFTKDSILQVFLETLIKGKLKLSSIHAEVIISNQIRRPDNILLTPDWSNENEEYKLITLNQALTDNPSITTSMQYQKLNKALYYPLSFKKNGKSFCDLLFMERPQDFINNQNLVEKSTIVSDRDESKSLITVFEDEE